LMGSPKDEKGHVFNEQLCEVQITEPFWFGMSLVRNGEWRKNTATSDQPKTCTWEQAIKFCESRTRDTNGPFTPGVYSLPTDAQWEYVCRAGTTTPWFTGSRKYSRTVATSKHPWGSLKMFEETSEWCMDSYLGKVTGGVNPLVSPELSPSRVYRGGSRFIPVNELPPSNETRSANRLWARPDDRYTLLGFRCCITIPS